MPNYEDLNYIASKILNYGNEVSIRKEQGVQLQIDELPPQYVPEKDVALEDIDSLLDDIKEDISEGLAYSDAPAETDNNVDDLDLNLDLGDDEHLTDDLSDIEDLDFGDDDLGETANVSTGSDNAWEDIADDSFNDLQNFDEPSGEDSGKSLDDFNFDMDFDDTPAPSGDDLDFDDIDLDSGSGHPDLPSIEDLDLPDEPAASTDETEPAESQSAPAGLADMSFLDEDSDDAGNLTDLSFDDIPSDNDTDSGILDSSSDDELGEINFNDDNNASAADTDDLSDMSFDDNITDMSFDDSPSSEAGSDDDFLNSMADSDNSGSDDDFLNSMADSGNSDSDDDFLNSMADNNSSGSDDDFLSNMANADAQPAELDFDNLSFDQGGADSDLSNLDNLSYDGSDTDALLGGFDSDNEGNDGGLNFDSDEGGLSFDDNDGGLSLDDFDNSNYNYDDFASDEANDLSDGEESPIGEESESADAELAADSVKEDSHAKLKEQDGAIILTDNQRKQIIKSLSVLPKEAELKIAKEIVSNNYSDAQIKPLIESLINKEKVVNVIRVYERITGDTSLSSIQNKKLSGQDFEDKQKSLAYQFQKNIMPIISRLALIMIVLLALIALYVKIIDPTLKASHYYKVGKQNIVERRFDNVEPYFDAAYKIQPRYKETLDYARVYRQQKRYRNSEEKYDLAYKMKPSRDLRMEMADFYCETLDFERAERTYQNLRVDDDKNIAIMLGLANTYYQWANVEPDKLETAKNIYQDVIDIDDKNKDALFHNMSIAIREKNDLEVMKYHNYIDKTFGTKKIDDNYIDSYRELSDYMYDTGRTNEMQDILDLIVKSPKARLMPEIEYGYAKLNKVLNRIGEEKIHLNNVLKQFEYMKEKMPLKYNESQALLSDTYNALGENAERFSKGSIESEKNYIKAIQINPRNGKAYYNLGNYALNYKVDFNNAKLNLLEAERLGFVNDKLNYNIGWISYKQQDYAESFKRIKPMADRYPDNTNLKLLLGTIYYRMGNYNFAEALLDETFRHFISLKQIRYPLEMDDNENRFIAEMLVNSANNLGATYQQMYNKNRSAKYSTMATKCYHDSIAYYDKLKESNETYLYEPQSSSAVDRQEVRLRKLQITNANQNLRMILYPAGGVYQPVLFEEFPLEYETYM